MDSVLQYGFSSSWLHIFFFFFFFFFFLSLLLQWEFNIMSLLKLSYCLTLKMPMPPVQYFFWGVGWDGGGVVGTIGG